MRVAPMRLEVSLKEGMEMSFILEPHHWIQFLNEKVCRREN